MTPEAVDIAPEHLAIAAERRDALLDARSAGIEESDDRRAIFQRHVLDLVDLRRMGFRQGAAEDGEILGEDEDLAAADRAPAGDDTVAGDLASGPCRTRRRDARRRCRTPRSCRHRAGCRAARGRSACPWHAGRRCAFRRRPSAHAARRASSSTRICFIGGILHCRTSPASCPFDSMSPARCDRPGGASSRRSFDDDAGRRLRPGPCRRQAPPRPAPPSTR